MPASNPPPLPPFRLSPAPSAPPASPVRLHGACRRRYGPPSPRNAPLAFPFADCDRERVARCWRPRRRIPCVPRGLHAGHRRPVHPLDGLFDPGKPHLRHIPTEWLLHRLFVRCEHVPRQLCMYRVRLERSGLPLRRLRRALAPCALHMHENLRRRFRLPTQ
jgi:hypothetical protein